MLFCSTAALKVLPLAVGAHREALKALLTLPLAPAPAALSPSAPVSRPHRPSEPGKTKPPNRAASSATTAHRRTYTGTSPLSFTRFLANRQQLAPQAVRPLAAADGLEQGVPRLSGCNVLAERIQISINRAADVAPINLLAVALLATPKHTMAEVVASLGSNLTPLLRTPIALYPRARETQDTQLDESVLWVSQSRRCPNLATCRRARRFDPPAQSLRTRRVRPLRKLRSSWSPQAR